MTNAPGFDLNGRTIVVRVDDADLAAHATLGEDLAFLAERNIRTILVAPSAKVARAYVRALNRHASVAVGLCGADAALLPAAADRVGAVQTGILSTLLNAGYLPVIEPTAFTLAGDDVYLAADDVASAIAMATVAARAVFFHESGGVIDPFSAELIAELTPAEALVLADRDEFAPDVRSAIRAAAHGVRGGVTAAQIIDGRVAHATIVEFLTDRHLGTRVSGSVFTA